MFPRQLTMKLKEESERERDPQLTINANKYDRIMRSLSVKRDNANKKVNIDIIQSFDETKLYAPPTPSDTPTKTPSPPSPSTEAKNSNKDSHAAAASEYVEVNINQLLIDIIDCLKDNCSNWFTNANLLRVLIPQALNYVDYNLKRNNNYIFEFESLLQAAQRQQENDLLKAQQQQQQQQQEQQPPPSPSSAASPSLLHVKDSPKEAKKRSKSLKILSRNKDTGKEAAAATLQKPNDLQNGSSEPNLNASAANGANSLNLSPANEFSRLQITGNLSSYLTDLRQQQAVQLTYRQLEQNITQIGYCLNTLNRFWSKGQNQDQAVFDELLNLFFINNSDNLNAFSQLDQFLYNINWQLTNKNVHQVGSDLDAATNDLYSILLTPATSTNLINMNFLLNYYRLINYDFISFKLFIRQLQLVQIAAILCQIIHRILNFYQRSAKSGAAGVNSKDFFVFPSSQYKPISWSNTHVTLHNVGQSPASPSMHQSHAAAAAETPSISSLFVSDLRDFLNLSINRLNNQADVVNQVGYFYIVNKSTGLVLEAFEQPFNTNASVNAKSAAALKAKAARFYLTPKVKSRGEQLWYYYAYNGCVANKLARSGHCMAASSLNAKSPVCLFPNVRTTNCKWYFNHVDGTIISGLGENLVLDFDEEQQQQQLSVPNAAATNTNDKHYAVVINKKEANKASQKWSIEFQ